MNAPSLTITQCQALNAAADLIDSAVPAHLVADLTITVVDSDHVAHTIKRAGNGWLVDLA